MKLLDKFFYHALGKHGCLSDNGIRQWHKTENCIGQSHKTDNGLRLQKITKNKFEKKNRKTQIKNETIFIITIYYNPAESRNRLSAYLICKTIQEIVRDVQEYQRSIVSFTFFWMVTLSSLTQIGLI